MIEAAVILLFIIVVYSYYESKKRQAMLSVENNRLAYLAAISKNSKAVDIPQDTNQIANKYKSLQTISNEAKIATNKNTTKSKFMAIKTLSV